jgi:hypothetical protein
MKLGDKKFVRLFVYGALMNQQTFSERLLGEFEDEGVNIEDDYNEYFCGMYKMPSRRFVFNKARNNKGVGSLIVGDHAEYVVGAVMYVPKSALRPGSDLSQSEGMISYDIFDVNTHYTLTTNSSTELIPLNHGGNAQLPILGRQSCFYFLAGVHHTSMSLPADETYKQSLMNALEARRNDGWDISSHYITYIKGL